MEKKFLYPITIGSLVINVTDPTRKTDNGGVVKDTLTNVLNNLKDSLAAEEKSGVEFASGNHIELAGIRLDLDLQDQTALQIIKALICPQYAPYYVVKTPSLTVNVKGATTRKWIGIAPTGADFGYTFKGRSIACYAGNYSETEETKQVLDNNTLDFNISSVSVPSDAAPNGVKYTAQLVLNVVINGEPTTSTSISVRVDPLVAIHDVYGENTRQVADAPATLISGVENASEDIVNHSISNEGVASEEYYLQAQSFTPNTVSITYYYPEYIYPIACTKKEGTDDLYEYTYRSHCKAVDGKEQSSEVPNTTAVILKDKVYVSKDNAHFCPLTIYAASNSTMYFLQYESIANKYSKLSDDSIMNNTGVIQYFAPDPEKGDWYPCTDENTPGARKFYKFQLYYHGAEEVSTNPLKIKITQ